MTEKETKIIEDGITIGGKSIREHAPQNFASFTHPFVFSKESRQDGNRKIERHS